MTPQHKAQLDAEVARLLHLGMEQLTTEEFYARYAAAGFRFDHSDTIRQFCTYSSGPFAGETSPCAALHPIHKGLKRSAFHFENPPEVYAAIKVLRNSIFAVTRDGYILEV